MKYGQWLRVWLENYVRPAVKQRTYEKYKQIISLHIAEGLGGYELAALTPARLQLYSVDLLKGGNRKNSGGLRPNSVNAIITVIQHSLKTAYSVGETDVYSGDKIKRPATGRSETGCFTAAEQKKIEDAIVSKKNVRMYGVILCMYTGLRIGELLALEKDDVDEEKRIIRVTKSCRDGKDEDGNFARCTDTPKTPSSVRIIPYPAQLAKYISALKNADCSKYLIGARGGKILSVRSYQRSFELLLKRLNIPHRGFHALRHTFATRALECGMDVKTLSEILGHKNPAMTLKHYAHSLDEHKSAMMDKVGALLD